MKKKRIFYVLIIIAFLLSGCGKKVKSENDIQKDIQTSSQFYNNQTVIIDNLNIEKRQTDKKEKRDIVYVEVKASNEEIDCNFSYILTYNLYNEGWILDDLKINSKGEWTIRPKKGPEQEYINKAIGNDFMILDADIDLANNSAIYIGNILEYHNNVKINRVMSYEFQFEPEEAAWIYNNSYIESNNDEWYPGDGLWSVDIQSTTYLLRIKDFDTENLKVNYDLYYNTSGSLSPKQSQEMHIGKTAYLQEYCGEDTTGYYFNMGYDFNQNLATSSGYLFGVLVDEDNMHVITQRYLAGSLDIYKTYDRYDVLAPYCYDEYEDLKAVSVTYLNEYPCSDLDIPNLDSITFGMTKNDVEKSLNIKLDRRLNGSNIESPSGVSYRGVESNLTIDNSKINNLLFFFGVNDGRLGAVGIGISDSENEIDNYIKKIPGYQVIENDIPMTIFGDYELVTGDSNHANILVQHQMNENYSNILFSGYSYAQ